MSPVCHPPGSMGDNAPLVMSSFRKTFVGTFAGVVAGAAFVAYMAQKPPYFSMGNRAQCVMWEVQEKRLWNVQSCFW